MREKSARNHAREQSLPGALKALPLQHAPWHVLTVVGSEDTTKLKASPHMGFRDAGMTELQGGT